MRTTVLGLFLVVSATGVQAQSWCPPGAEWVFKPDGSMPFLIGYSHVRYAGDTVVDGKLAQRLSRHHVSIYQAQNPWAVTNTFEPAAHITHEENGVVTKWNGIGWDTLYWFSGEIGDQWRGLHPEEWPDSWLEITDTATVVIDGVPLRQRLITDHCWDLAAPVEWVTERKGGMLELWLPCLCEIDGGGWTFDCYRDDQIGPPNIDLCIPNLPLSVHEPLTGNFTPPYPNPGSTHFSLDLPPGPHTIELFDATGRCVYNQRTTGPRTEVPTTHLPAGIYYLLLNGHGQAWVKE